SEEMGEGFRQVAAQRAGEEERSKAEPLNAGEAEELARLLLSERHMKPELLAFFYAWAGSINHIGPGLRSMSVELFRPAFEHLASTCRLPDLAGSRAEHP